MQSKVVMINWESDQTGICGENSLEEKFPSAFSALPEPYQNDNCLNYYSKTGVLYCCPQKSEQAALGVWICFFNEATCSWEDENKNNVDANCKSNKSLW